MTFARALVVSMLLVMVARSALAGEEGQSIGNLKTQVLDLVFKVEDLGGKIQDLQLKESDTEIRIELAADVLFDFDKADVRREAQKPLKQVADIIREKAKGAVRIEGHTDSKGSDAYNQKLSDRRATRR